MRPRPIVVGNLNVDMVMGPLDPWPQAGTEIVLPQYRLRPGGSAGNAALALTALGLDPVLVTNVGSDLFADWLADGMPMQKIVAREDTATTISVGLTHPTGERTFLTNPGHIGALSPGFVREALAGIVAPSATVLFCGAFLTTRLAESYPKLFGWLHEKGAAVALDTGWPPDGWDQTSRDALGGWARLADHLLLSAAEIGGFTECADIDAAASRLLPCMRPGATLIAKRGAAGAMAWCGAEMVSCAAKRVAVIDTIGAGDVFNAGYIAALLKGDGLAEAVRAGVQTATTAISTDPRRYEPGVR